LIPVVSSLPAGLQALLSPSDLAVARAWWSALDEPERSALLDSWDPRAHSCRYSRPEGEGRWRRLAIWLEAEVPGNEDPDEIEWPIDLYEYLIGHEIFLSDRTPAGHICTRHEAGRRAAREAGIAAHFECPAGEAGCPLRALSEQAGRQRLRFVLRVCPEDGEPHERAPR
jgi:hypothetical protein